jgi:hypothetical protein
MTSKAKGTPFEVPVPTGRPLSGQTFANSGQAISIAYSRPGDGFGNVSSWSADRVMRGTRRVRG